MDLFSGGYLVPSLALFAAFYSLEIDPEFSRWSTILGLLETQAFLDYAHWHPRPPPPLHRLFFTRLSFALMLASPSAWCLCIFWWLLMERRIRREERYLQAKFGSAYDLYAENTAAYPNTVHLGAILVTLVGQTIAFRGLPPSGSAGRRHKPIVCPTETPLSEQYCT